MPSNPPDDLDALREKIIGLGERSLHKSYYPELQDRLSELERFRTLLDQTYDAIFLIQADTGIPVDINASARVCLGYTRKELLATPFTDLLSPEHRAGFTGFIRKIGEHPTETRHTCIASLISREGREIPMEITARSVTFDDRQYLVVIARDITDRILAERELKIKESALESSTNGILIADLDGVVMYANRSFALMFGYGEGRTLARKNIREFFANPAVGEDLPGCLLDDHAIVQETVGLRNNGSMFHIQVSGSIVQNDAGQPLCVMLIVMDISERVITEQMKRETYAQLGKNIEQFAVLGDHIRNPLQVIVGYAGMIDDPLAGKILDQSRQIDELITRLDRGWVESANVRLFLRKHGDGAEVSAEWAIRTSTTTKDES
ncbi:MAG: PAS domain S-box protein [Methanomicrobiales archaeon]|nr:PAS domain S-box protein [Methanomicrobiales archaeon]